MGRQNDEMASRISTTIVVFDGHLQSSIKWAYNVNIYLPVYAETPRVSVNMLAHSFLFILLDYFELIRRCINFFKWSTAQKRILSKVSERQSM